MPRTMMRPSAVEAEVVVVARVATKARSPLQHTVNLGIQAGRLRTGIIAITDLALAGMSDALLLTWRQQTPAMACVGAKGR